MLDQPQPCAHPVGRGRIPAHIERDDRPYALHSTGSVTPEGKAVSSRNATTHGIFACIDALPPHERAILDRFLARNRLERLLPGLLARERRDHILTGDPTDLRCLYPSANIIPI